MTLSISETLSSPNEQLKRIGTIDRLARYALENSMAWLRIELDRKKRTAHLMQTDASNRTSKDVGKFDYKDLIIALTSEDMQEAVGWSCETEEDIFNNIGTFHTESDDGYYCFVGESLPNINSNRTTVLFTFFLSKELAACTSTKCVH